MPAFSSPGIYHNKAALTPSTNENLRSQRPLKVLFVLTLTNKHMLKATTMCEPHIFQETSKGLKILLMINMIKRKISAWLNQSAGQGMCLTERTEGGNKLIINELFYFLILGIGLNLDDTESQNTRWQQAEERVM